METIAKGKAGLGWVPAQLNKAEYMGRCQLIQNEFRVEAEKQRYYKMVGLSEQRVWPMWE